MKRPNGASGSVRRTSAASSRRRALVGVELEDPVAAAGGDAGVAPRAFEHPGTLDDAVGMGAGDLGRAVGAAVEHNHQLVAEPHRRQAGGEIVLLVMGDDQSGQAGLGMTDPVIPAGDGRQSL